MNYKGVYRTVLATPGLLNQEREAPLVTDLTRDNSSYLENLTISVETVMQF